MKRWITRNADKIVVAIAYNMPATTNKWQKIAKMPSMENAQIICETCFFLMRKSCQYFFLTIFCTFFHIACMKVYTQRSRDKLQTYKSGFCSSVICQQIDANLPMVISRQRKKTLWDFGLFGNEEIVCSTLLKVTPEKAIKIWDLIIF